MFSDFDNGTVDMNDTPSGDEREYLASVLATLQKAVCQIVDTPLGAWLLRTIQTASALQSSNPMTRKSAVQEWKFNSLGYPAVSSEQDKFMPKEHKIDIPAISVPSLEELVNASSVLAHIDEAAHEIDDSHVGKWIHGASNIVAAMISPINALRKEAVEDWRKYPKLSSPDTSDKSELDRLRGILQRMAEKLSGPRADMRTLMSCRKDLGEALAGPLCEDEGCPHHGTPHVCVEKESEV